MIAVVVLLGVGIGIYLATRCEHEWENATCVVPRTCRLCGKQEGDLGEHEWEEATCTVPKTCRVCGATEGELAPHQWKDATCTELKTCRVCSATEGELAPHQWEEATCQHPRQCSVCSQTEGEALPHQWEAATCTTPETCMVCNETRGDALGHSPIPATCIEAELCAVCGERLGNKNDINNHNLDADGVCLWCGNTMGLKFTDNNYRDYFLIYAESASYLDSAKRLVSGENEWEISLYVEPKKISNRDISYDNVILDVDITYRTISWKKPSTDVTYHTQMNLSNCVSGKKYYQKVRVDSDDYFSAGASRSDFQLQVRFSGYAILKDSSTGDMLRIVQFSD